ncbi:flagellar protein FlaG [Undibacterium seohonense]|jgi:flagellar protein FlaG|uniref:Flagellar protein FlaG n=1 Tax=Undibacterium seohonense TaxID=1344950 RepID=A0ABR6X8C3_9BURK|nr:flagellar protein FlaG [Undibacterium seohonense]MBC3809055.1 flagellar protein FlaG [Undibacterium seohonense]
MNIPSLSTATSSAPLSDRITNIPRPINTNATATQVANPVAEAGASQKTYTREQVNEAVEAINKTIQAASQNLEFSVDKDTSNVIVKVIDQQTKEVLRQIPTEEALEIAKSLDRLQGLLIKQTA